MGYYVDIEDISWEMSMVHEEKAFKALCALNHDPDIDKRGRSFSNGEPDKRWFSWMPEDYDKTTKSVYDILNMLGFEVEILPVIEEEVGELEPWEKGYSPQTLYIYSYSSKIGQENLFLQALAPFVKEGSYIVWRGEHGERWKDAYEDGKMITYSARTVWDRPRF